MASVTKIEEWRRRLARFRDSRETVARFCRKEGVSEPTFYAWRKRLGDSPGTAPGASSRFVPVEITVATSSSARRETVVHLGPAVQIEFGSDLAVVGTVVRQLLQAMGDAHRAETDRC